jgi:hypothetical protein
MTDSQDRTREVRFTWRLSESTSTPRISILGVALLAFTLGPTVALIVTATKPVTSTTRSETTSVLDHKMIWTTLGAP